MDAVGKKQSLSPPGLCPTGHKAPTLTGHHLIGLPGCCMLTCQAAASCPAGPPPCWPAGLPFHEASTPQTHRDPAQPDLYPPANQATTHLLSLLDRTPQVTSQQACQATTHPLPTTRGLQHHQTLVPNLRRRHRQTGLDAKGIKPEQLTL
jgi:hypothetical protein